ncbi:hypothetical protein SRHO_G00047880 [Serrasalmus rhombeus]
MNPEESLPPFQTSGDFLGHLMAMVFSLSPVSMENRARADQHLFLLQDEALLVLDDIFGGEEHVYQDAGSLALAVGLFGEACPAALVEAPGCL